MLSPPLCGLPGFVPECAQQSLWGSHWRRRAGSLARVQDTQDPGPSPGEWSRRDWTGRHWGGLAAWEGPDGKSPPSPGGHGCGHLSHPGTEATLGT